METATDNRNRTAAEVRSIFSKAGGQLAGQGSVAWQFTPKAYFTFATEGRSEDEAFELSGSTELEPTVEVLKQHAGSFVITRGNQGALVFDGEQLIDIEAFPVQAVDTLGAGDMFAGAFLYGLTHAMDYRAAGQLAALTSAHLVTQFGPRLPTRQTLDLLQQFKAGNF